jgi:hypothetical protein
MNVHRLLPLGLASIVFLLPLVVAAQTVESDSLALTAHDPETGEALPTQDGKASIDGTPGDGVRDKFNYTIRISIPDGSEPESLQLTVILLDDEMAEKVEDGAEIYGATPSPWIGEESASISGSIDLSYDTEFGQMLRYLGRLKLPDGSVAEFDESLTVGCVCPRAGSWTASNYPGTMVCTGIANLTIPLMGSTQTGDLGVYDGCRTLHYTNFDDEYADVAMQRVPGECGYEGEAHGLPMESSFTFDVQTEEFLIGSLRMEMAEQGATCIMTRDFEVRFND